MKQFMEYVKANKLMLIFGAVVTTIFLALIIGIVFISQKHSSSNQRIQQPQSGNEIPNTSQAQQQTQSFHVIRTSPGNNELNVYPGEILISFETDINMPSQQAFSLEIKPPLDYPFTDITTYPTRTIQEKVIGGLKQGTTYTVIVKNGKGTQVYSWSFTTSQQPAESSSALTATKQQEQIDQYYPLFNDIPYATNDYSIEYTDKLTLTVHIKNANTAVVKNEVLAWIRSKGIDPSTHTINYINDF